MSGLRINYQKSEVFVLGVDEEEQNRVADLFNCNIGTFPMKYLGVMLSSKHMCVKLSLHTSKDLEEVANIAMM
jgi:hypothetical protein